jgi:hypothetical protein
MCLSSDLRLPLLDRAAFASLGSRFRLVVDGREAFEAKLRTSVSKATAQEVTSWLTSKQVVARGSMTAASGCGEQHGLLVIDCLHE